MLGKNVKMAISSLKTTRWRSGLTMLGIVVGVSSVVTIVSLGDGLKQQVSGQIKSLGSNVLTLRPGHLSKNTSQSITGLSPFSLGSNSTLDEKDYLSVKQVAGIKYLAPTYYAGNTVVVNNKTFDDALIMGSTAGFSSIYKYELAYGSFFGVGDTARSIAVVGFDLAFDKFGSANPIGESLIISGQLFVVVGVYQQVKDNSLSAAGFDINNSVIIPFDTAKQLVAGRGSLSQVVVKLEDSADVDQAVSAINQSVLSNHKGQQDFSVLKQADLLKVNDNLVNTLTKFITAIAGISLIVGGIGIMNIMLVSVTERTKEIGIRKAIGATNRQILVQYLTEGMALSVSGGVLGVFVAFMGNMGFRIFTDIKPTLNWKVFLASVVVSVLIGMVFSVAPALKAARKDPIRALRGD